MGFFSKKPIHESFYQSASHSAKNLHWYHLLAYGISATIGSGIYVTIGVTAKEVTGPSVILSILIAGTLSCLTGLCYLELSNMVPASGSSYSWGVTFLGEGFGWILGWTSTLEYAFAGSCTAVAISQYLYSLSIYFKPIPLVRSLINPDDYMLVFNFVALSIILLVTPIVVKGITFGAKTNNIIATVNISVLLFIVTVGLFYISPENWTPFFLTDSFGNQIGSSSNQVISGALIMIYSFLGFDTICVFLADAISPRHVQIAVMGTLAIASFLYMSIALVITGMLPLSQIDITTPLSSAFLDCNLYFVYIVIKICALCMLVATLLACLLGQPKIFQIISLDGLVPQFFSSSSSMSNKVGSIPVLNSAICCGVSAVMATFFNVYSLIEIISTGALLTFTINASTVIVAKSPSKGIGYWVTLFACGNFISWSSLNFGLPFYIPMIISCICIGVPFIGLLMLYLSGKNAKSVSGEHATDSSICPLMPLIPCATISGNTFILSTVTLITWAQFLGWLAVGMGIYAFYGYKHSKIASFSLATNKI